MSITTRIQRFLTESNDIVTLESMKAAIEDKFADPVFENCWTQVSVSTNISNSLTIRFTPVPRSKWPNNIMHNANPMLIMVHGGRGVETSLTVYRAESLMATRTGMPKMIAKSGNGPTVLKYLLKYFDKVGAALPTSEEIYGTGPLTESSDDDDSDPDVQRELAGRRADLYPEAAYGGDGPWNNYGGEGPGGIEYSLAEQLSLLYHSHTDDPVLADLFVDGAELGDALEAVLSLPGMNFDTVKSVIMGHNVTDLEGELMIVTDLIDDEQGLGIETQSAADGDRSLHEPYHLTMSPLQ